MSKNISSRINPENLNAYRSEDIVAFSTAEDKRLVSVVLFEVDSRGILITVTFFEVMSGSEILHRTADINSAIISYNSL